VEQVDGVYSKYPWMRDFCGFGASDFFDFGDSGARNPPPRSYLCIMLPRGWLLRAVEGLLGSGGRPKPNQAATRRHSPTSSYLTSPSRVLNSGGI
jgi:hypothetical protein